MVFPFPQRPTDSGKTRNIAPGNTTRRARRELQDARAPVVLRSVDRTYSVKCEISICRRTVAALATDLCLQVSTPGALDTDLVVRGREVGDRRTFLER